MAQAALDLASSSERRGADVPPELEPAWQRAHAELVRLAKHRAGLDDEEGRWLLAALREGTHVRFGFGSFNEYSERMFGYGPKVTQEKLRVAEALESLPTLAGELREGALNFSVVKELTRVATRDTEGDWLQVARGRTVREVEQLVSGRRPGNRPDDAADPRAKRHVSVRGLRGSYPLSVPGQHSLGSSWLHDAFPRTVQTRRTQRPQLEIARPSSPPSTELSFDSPSQQARSRHSRHSHKRDSAMLWPGR